MDNPQHSSRPAFDKARDELEAWRRQQIAGLTPSQRDRYETLGREHEARLDDAAAKLAENERTRIIASMRDHLSQKPRPVAKPHGARGDLNDADRKQLVDAVPDYVDGKDTPSRFAGLLGPSHDLAAAREYEAREAALRPLREMTQLERDEFLRTCERERSVEAVRGKAQADFDKAADKAPLRRDFEKAAIDDGTREDPVKSDAIARAIAKVKAKEEEERARDERERLTDTFNRAR